MKKLSRKLKKEPVIDYVIINGLRYRKMYGCLVLDQIVENTIDQGFHSPARKNCV